MTERVNPETLLCHAHDLQGCSLCMVADFNDWIVEQRAKRAARRAAAMRVGVVTSEASYIPPVPCTARSCK